MSTMNDLISAVDKVGSRIDVVEKALQASANRREGVEAITKALTHAGGGNGREPVYAAGWEGGSTLSLLHAGRRKKLACGMGDFLQHVAAIGDRQNVEGHDKALQKMGSKAVNKSALAEGAGSTGGYLVPPQFLGQILQAVMEEAFVAAQCFNLPMATATMDIPCLDQSKTPPAGTTAFAGGIIASWQPEGATINESDPIWRQVQLVARNLQFITVASNQLLQDNGVALDTFLTSLITSACAWFKDYYIINGTGANQPLGFLNAPGTYIQSRGTGSQVNFVDLAKMQSHLLAQGGADTAIWIMHPSVLPSLIQMTNGATNSAFLLWFNPSPPDKDGPLAQQLPTRVMGRPVLWSEKVPVLGSTGDVCLFDGSKQLLGDRLAVQIEASPYPRWTNNQMTWRTIMRWDSQPMLNLPITLSPGSGAFQQSNAVILSA